MKIKNKKITIIVLACALVALILLYFFVIAPLLDEQSSTRPPVDAQDGEGVYYGTLTMYPEIKQNDVISITVNNSHGTYSLVNRIDEKTGSLALTLEKYPTLRLSTSALSALRIYTLNTQCKTNEPLRNCTPEKMAQYGVTKETCSLSYTIKYKDNGTEREHTVYIGDRTLSASGSYFATVEGRSTIYEISSGLDGGLLLAKEDFVDPLIASYYNNSEVVYEVNKILIGNSSASVPYVGIGATRVDSKETILVKYTVQYPVKAKNVSASSSYISTALTQLLVGFTGNRVAEIDPSEETREKYGLGLNDDKKFVSIGTFDEKEYIFTISHKRTNEDGEWYYVLVPAATSRDVALIVEVSAVGYEFLEEENAVKWVATNSYEAGFTKYIYENSDVGESGVADITISANTGAVKNFNEKFILTHSPHPTDPSKDKILTVTSESGKYYFKDDIDASEAAYKNEFKNFYAILVTYPMPNRFNTMSQAEIDAKKTSDNLLLSVRVTLNDGTKIGYDYYELDATNIMCEFFDEKNEAPRVVFDTTAPQLNILVTALNQLISGEHVEKH